MMWKDYGFSKSCAGSVSPAFNVSPFLLFPDNSSPLVFLWSFPHQYKILMTPPIRFSPKKAPLCWRALLFEEEHSPMSKSRLCPFPHRPSSHRPPFAPAFYLPPHPKKMIVFCVPPLFFPLAPNFHFRPACFTPP